MYTVTSVQTWCWACHGMAIVYNVHNDLCADLVLGQFWQGYSKECTVHSNTWSWAYRLKNTIYTMTSVQTWCWACPGVGTPGLVEWVVLVSREQGRNAYEAFFFVIVYFLLGLLSSRFTFF
jgi:hypothetical protein